MDESTQPLNPADLQSIVQFVKEDHGRDLDKRSFTEAMLMMLEDIPGCEFVNPNETEAVDTAYLLYQQIICKK